MNNIKLFIISLVLCMGITLAESTKPTFGEQNMGKTDRIVRLVVGLGLAGIGSYYAFSEEESWGYIPLGVSAIPLLTSATGICPLYYLFGIDTRSKSQVSMIVSPQKAAGLQYSLLF